MQLLYRAETKRFEVRWGFRFSPSQFPLINFKHTLYNLPIVKRRDFLVHVVILQVLELHFLGFLDARRLEPIQTMVLSNLQKL